MNRFALLALGCFSLAPLTSHAVAINDELAVQLDLSLASDYRSRGISQTKNDPAAQFGATLQHISGLYLGVWTSNVDFGFGLKTRQEVEYYAGWLWQITEPVSLDLGYIKYAYPNESQFNQSEVYAILNAYGFILGNYYSGDAPGEDSKQSTLYNYLGYETRLPLETGLKLRYGRMDFKDPRFWSQDGQSSEAYHEWEAKLTHDFVGLTWGLSYIDTDLSDSQCASNSGFTDTCSATWVASVSSSF
ncbi:TorF family putative porin [Pseudomonas sp. NPDC087697]|uniref:TorF family putative porin n=1 Tax=Pseudomonas sp. NPDC087697 TaxID=3364447 RepID=UPI003814FE53